MKRQVHEESEHGKNVRERNGEGRASKPRIQTPGVGGGRGDRKQEPRARLQRASTGHGSSPAQEQAGEVHPGTKPRFWTECKPPSAGREGVSEARESPFRYIILCLRRGSDSSPHPRH